MVLLLFWAPSSLQFFFLSFWLVYRAHLCCVWGIEIYEPAHEIMVLFVLRKLILQTRMCSHPVGLDVWFLVGRFICFHTSLRGCTGLPEPSMVAYVISTICHELALFTLHFTISLHCIYTRSILALCATGRLWYILEKQYHNSVAFSFTHTKQLCAFFSLCGTNIFGYSDVLLAFSFTGAWEFSHPLPNPCLFWCFSNKFVTVIWPDYNETIDKSILAF